MPNTVAWVFCKNVCKRQMLTLVSGAHLLRIMPLAKALILAAWYPLEDSNVLAFSVTMAASLPLAVTRRHEARATLPHKGKGAPGDVFLHALCAFAPGANLYPQYLEPVE